MGFFIVKVVITALIVAVVSEVSKRLPFVGAMIVSFPLISILAFIWIYVETKDTSKVIEMSQEIFWLVLPSLLFFVVLPLLLSRNVSFLWSMVISCVVTSMGYAGFSWLIHKLGIH